MELTTANKICKRLSCQYGIVNPPEVIPLKYSRTGKRVALGYYDDARNTIEINKYALEEWTPSRNTRIIQHELVHTRCYQDYGVSCGHDKRFRDMCDLLGITGDTRRATTKRKDN